MKQLKKKLTLLLLAVTFSFILFTLLGFLHFRKGDRIVIGAKNCTEQHILGETLAQLVELRTDIPVKRCFNLDGTAIAFSALRSSTIDVYFEYTGTALLDILKEPPRPDSYNYVKEAFKSRYKLQWLEPVGFANQYGLVVCSDSPFHRISDIPNKAKWAIDPEFFTRMEFSILKKAYPLNPKSTLMDPAILYFSLGRGSVNVISGYSTDGHLADEKYRILKDDKRVFPSYIAAPLIRKKTLKKYPELNGIFALLSGGISDREMRDLNYRVEILGEKTQFVVKELIQQKGWN